MVAGGDTAGGENSDPAATSTVGVARYTASAGTAPTGEWKPSLENVPGENVRGTWVPIMSLRMIATTRRGRISDWALGAFIAALPGGLQTLIEMYSTKQIPAIGHQVEVAILLVSIGFLFKSLADFSKPTSLDALEEACPGAARGLSWFAAVGRAMRRWKSDFKGEY